MPTSLFIHQYGSF